MMIKTKSVPVGIDVLIQNAQSRLFTKLLTVWGISPDMYASFGRCYRNRTAAGFVAQWYNGGAEYVDPYFDDTLAAVSFWGIGSKETHAIGESISVHLVFFVNLAKLKPSVLHRADEEVRRDVQGLIGSGLYGLRYDNTELWTENCLREYPETAKRMIQDYKFDFHPLHVFRLNFTANYRKDICNSLNIN